MGLELIRDILRFEQVVGEGQSQALVNRDIIVPDIKPDIARILSVEGKVNITSKDVEQDRIAVEGDVNLQILYAANGEPQPIYSMNQSANFSHYIDVPNAMPKMDADIKCDIEHIDFDRLNGRKVNMRCVLNLKGKVTDILSLDAVKEVSGVSDIQLLRDTIVTDEIVGNNTAQTVIKGSINIPQSMPHADELLKYNATIHSKDVKLEDDRVVITGKVFVPVLYSSKEENPDIFKVEEDMEFTHTLEMSGVTPDMLCYVDYRIEDVYAELKENDEEEKRQVDVEVVVNMRATVSQKKEFPAIIDAYAPSIEIECEKKNIAMDIFYARDSAQAVVKESVSLPADMPGIDKVYDMVCIPTVTDYKLVDDKVVIEGVLVCDVIYHTRNEENIVNSFQDEIPFRTSVIIPGCNSAMKPEVEVDIESMDGTMLTKNEVELRIILNCYVKLYNKVFKELITKIDQSEAEIQAHKASITIYVVQNKDTLWSIAKRYSTTVEDLVRVNEIVDADKLMPGMKLIIPKRA
ncbi:membrane-bound lytic murein transglycosylase D [Oxobacter pfennigii]|uniref:Membrane-bound lytic murein transglycosylase D n=1 Tax=Oxobacter pfennigii TaxID=36849 RepID=A0A0P8WA22_9CLOT|nr:SPOCS domain-containing protein [Oxobacter pfennigii]KPU44571.1 membrane-bound lytic murein transglycosylase D [Oxobacter pfennigii]